MDEILEYFFEEPEREFHVRELAKTLRLSPTTMSKHLGELKRKGLLSDRKKYNHLLYKASTESKDYRNAKLSFNIKKLHESGLIKFLVEEYNNPEAIILFGSFSKAENTKKSDIDLLIISPMRTDLILKKFEEKLGHEIQLFIYSKEQIEKMKRTNKELLNSFINGLVLDGYWEAF